VFKGKQLNCSRALGRTLADAFNVVDGVFGEDEPVVVTLCLDERKVKGLAELIVMDGASPRWDLEDAMSRSMGRFAAERWGHKLHDGRFSTGGI
jgi:hypothetical protein